MVTGTIAPTQAPDVEDDSVAGLDATCLYLRDLRRSPLTRPLTADEEITWGRRARAGEQQAINRLTLANTRLVVTIARKYVRVGGVPLADLIAEGNLGLLHAITKFDPDRGLRFSTYAGWWIHHDIQRGIMNKKSLIRVPVYVQKDLAQRRRQEARAIAASSAGAPAAPAEEAASWPFVRSASPAPHDPRPLAVFLSIDVDEDPDNGGAPLRDRLADARAQAPESAIQARQVRETITRWLAILTPRQRFVLEQRLGLNDGEPTTATVLANTMGITRERVRQIQVQAVRVLRKRARAEGTDIAALF